jgi:hypothetical protein
MATTERWEQPETIFLKSYKCGNETSHDSSYRRLAGGGEGKVGERSVATDTEGTVWREE